MFHKSFAIMLLPAFTSLAGCAGYSLTPITPAQAAETGKEGYIFYEPEPYLLGVLRASKLQEIKQAVEGGGPETTVPVSAADAYDFRIVYLPNKRRPYRFTRYELLAKSDLKITFEDGWKFTGAESKTDSTAALAALVDLAKASVGALSRGPGSPLPGVVLYRIDTAAVRPDGLLQQVYP